MVELVGSYKINTAVFISGTGSNLKNLIKFSLLKKDNAIAENRKIMGATNPEDADPGTIRREFGISIDKNSIHGSDSKENAEKEISFFLKIR